MLFSLKHWKDIYESYSLLFILFDMLGHIRMDVKLMMARRWIYLFSFFS